MGELHNAVSALLDAFARGIAVIKTHRGRRKKGEVPIDSTHKTAETHLCKSLKRSRVDVKNAYGRDLARFGPGFADGDAEARSSLSAILFRLNAGFVSVIERFTRGRSNAADYQALVNLSNASRMEAIHTIEQLSNRLSQSYLILAPRNKGVEKHNRIGHRKKAKKNSSVEHVKHTRSKSAQQLSMTPLGRATSEGWIRRKPGRRLSLDSKSSGSSAPKLRVASKLSSSSVPRLHSPPTRMQSPTSPARNSYPYPPIQIPAHTTQLSSTSAQTLRTVPLRSRYEKRKSFMSFESDSTKLGEIPEYKWTRPGMFEEGLANFPVRTYYPLEPYQKPEKQRSRFMKLFKRS